MRGFIAAAIVNSLSCYPSGLCCHGYLTPVNKLLDLNLKLARQMYDLSHKKEEEEEKREREGERERERGREREKQTEWPQQYHLTAFTSLQLLCFWIH